MSNTAELTSTQPLLIQLLLEKEILTPAQIDGINEARAKDHTSLEATLVGKGLVMDQHIAEAYADYLMVPMFDMVPSVIDPRLASLLPEKLCRENMFVPVELHDDTLDVAFTTFEAMLMVDELQLLTNLNICPMIGSITMVEKFMETLYRTTRTNFIEHIEEYAGDDDSEDLPEDSDGEEILDIDVPPPPGPDGRVVRMVNQILEQALRAGASDIHIEPFEESCAIRLRVDGAPARDSATSPIAVRIRRVAF